MVSERDILNSLGRGEDPDSERVGDHMTDTVISAAPDWSLERAAVEMSRRHIRHLVVVDGGSWSACSRCATSSASGREGATPA